MEVKVEKAKSSQVNSIKNLLQKTWLDTYSHILSKTTIENITSSWHSISTLNQEINDSNVTFLTAKNQKNYEIAGILSGRVTNKKVFNLDRLYVLPDFQQMGIGTVLLNHVIKTLTQIREIHLKVGKQNKKGVSFWEKKGFKATDEEQIEVDGNKLTILQMKKIL